MNFPSTTNRVERVKRHASNCDKISAVHATHKGLVSRICKEFLQVNIKRISNSLAKWGKGMARHLARREHAIYKSMKWCLTSEESEGCQSEPRRDDVHVHPVSQQTWGSLTILGMPMNDLSPPLQVTTLENVTTAKQLGTILPIQTVTLLSSVAFCLFGTGYSLCSIRPIGEYASSTVRKIVKWNQPKRPQHKKGQINGCRIYSVCRGTQWNTDEWTTALGINSVKSILLSGKSKFQKNTYCNDTLYMKFKSEQNWAVASLDIHV